MKAKRDASGDFYFHAGETVQYLREVAKVARESLLFEGSECILSIADEIEDAVKSLTIATDKVLKPEGEAHD